MHYLDNAATTKVHPKVANTIADALLNVFANPSSLYSLGMQAEDHISAARAVLAEALGCAVGEVIFTGSGTESNNIAILGAARARAGWGKHLVATGYEHSSVAGPLELLVKQEGFSLTLVPPEPDGTISQQKLVQALTPATVLVCAMHCNNETGALLDVASLATTVKAQNPRTAVHVDGIQAFCKQPLSLNATKIDTYAISGHKIHAPKGVAALYIRRGLHISPISAGGSQEFSHRPGTENTPYIMGLAQAVQIAQASATQNLATIQALHTRLMQGIKTLPGIMLNSPPNAWPGIVNISLPASVRSQPTINLLADKHNVYISGGSACDKGAPSPTLTAMGLPSSRVESALRISFSGENTPGDVDVLLSALKDAVASLSRHTAKAGPSTSL